MNLNRMIIGMLVGSLIGSIAVAVANYESKRTHCYSAKWTPSAGWVCKVPRADQRLREKFDGLDLQRLGLSHAA